MMYELVIAYIIRNTLDQDEATELTKVFRLFDLNGDGNFSKDEFKKVFKKYLSDDENLKKKEMETIFDNIDTDRNGYVEYEEFVRACISRKSLIYDDILMRKAFIYFSDGKSSSITKDSLKRIISKHNEQLMEKDEMDVLATKLLDELKLDESSLLFIRYDKFRAFMEECNKSK